MGSLTIDGKCSGSLLELWSKHSGLLLWLLPLMLWVSRCPLTELLRGDQSTYGLWVWKRLSYYFCTLFGMGENAEWNSASPRWANQWANWMNQWKFAFQITWLPLSHWMTQHTGRCMRNPQEIKLGSYSSMLTLIQGRWFTSMFFTESNNVTHNGAARRRGGPPRAARFSPSLGWAALVSFIFFFYFEAERGKKVFTTFSSTLYIY